MTSSWGGGGSAACSVSDAGYVGESDDSLGAPAAARDEADAKKMLINHFDRTSSLDSSRTCRVDSSLSAFCLLCLS